MLKGLVLILDNQKVRLIVLNNRQYKSKPTLFLAVFYEISDS